MAAVVQQNDLVFEFASNVMEDEQQVWDPEKIGFFKLIIMILPFATENYLL